MITQTRMTRFLKTWKKTLEESDKQYKSAYDKILADFDKEVEEIRKEEKQEKRAAEKENSKKIRFQQRNQFRKQLQRQCCTAYKRTSGIKVQRKNMYQMQWRRQSEIFI